MPRSSRPFVLLSLLLAAGAYLVSLRVEHPRHAWWAAAAALVGALGARMAPALTEAVLLAAAFVGPGLMHFALGWPDVLLHSTWLVPMAAFLAAERPSAGWSMPRPWRWLLITWALIVAVCWPIVFLRELDFTPSASLLTEAYSNGVWPDRISRWTTSVAAAALCSMAGVAWFDRLFRRLGPGGDSTSLASAVIAVPAAGGAVAGAVALYQSWVRPTFLNYGVWLELKRATGTLLDSNALGILAATWPVVLAGLVVSGRGKPVGTEEVRTPGEAGAAPHARLKAGELAPEAWRYAAAAAILVAGWLVVFASGSRTAFAAILVGTGFLAAGVAGAKKVARWKLLAAAAAAIALFVGLLGAGAATGVLRTATPLQRIATSLPAPTLPGAAAFARSLWVRDGWGRAAMAMIREHPLSGVGIGTFSRQSVDYAQRVAGVLLPPDNAQNWWRQQAAEFGLAGAAFAGLLTVFVVRLLGRRAAPDRRPAAGGVRGALAGLAVASLFGVPTLAPVVAFSAWTFLFLAVQWLEPSDPPAFTRSHWLGAAVVALAVLSTGLGQAYAATHDMRPPMRTMRAGVGYGYGFWRGGTDADGQPFWWTGRRAVFVFPAEPGVLEFIVVPMHPDIALRPVGVEIWLDGRKVLDEQARDQSPIRLRVPATPERRAFFIETRVSRTFPAARGMEQALRIQKTYDRPAR